VDIPDEVKHKFGEDELSGLIEILSLDPRPSYQDDPDRIYGLSYAGSNIKFRVAEDRLIVIMTDTTNTEVK